MEDNNSIPKHVTDGGIFFLFCLRVKLQSRIKTTVGTYKGEDEIKIVHKMYRHIDVCIVYFQQRRHWAVALTGFAIFFFSNCL